jgi:hypothetical protein
VELVRDAEQRKLIAEGHQFCETLRSLPLAEQQEILENARSKWEETQKEIRNFLNNTNVFAMPISHVEVSQLEWNGRTYRLGPHLWEEAPLPDTAT